MNDKKAKQILEDEFNIDYFLNPKDRAFVEIRWLNKDGQGHVGAHTIHRSSLEGREYDIYVPPHYLSNKRHPEASPAGMGNLITITITDTLFDTETWKPIRPLKTQFNP
jgi:hypothetical protein